MGDWALMVTGTGPHHNENPEIDIDIKAKEFVKNLKEFQNIRSAKLIVGGSQELNLEDEEWKT